MKTTPIAIAALALALSAGSATAEEWKIQTLFAPGTILYDGFAEMAEKVKTASDGRLVITPMPVGAVVGPTGTMDAIKAGVLAGHFTWPGLWGGIEPGFAAIADLTGGYDTPYQQVEMMEHWGGRELLEDLYAANGLKTVGVFYNGVESLPSKRDVPNVAALDGMKIRLPPGITSDVFAKLGAAPVVLPLSEAFSALDKGVVDAADGFSLGDNAAQGFYDIVGYSLYPGIHSAPILDFSVSKEKWDALPDDLKQIVASAAREAALTMLGRRMADDSAAAGALAEKGIVLVEWSDEDRDAFRQAAREVWQEYAGKSDQAGKAVELQTGYLSQMGLLK